MCFLSPLSRRRPLLNEDCAIMDVMTDCQFFRIFAGQIFIIMIRTKVFLTLLSLMSVTLAVAQPSLSGADAPSASVDTAFVSDMLCFDVISKRDPLNPVDTSLEPSSRWYSFRLTGVGGRRVMMRFFGTEANRPFFSYDGKNYSRFKDFESLGEDVIVSDFEHDTVYVSYFVPYTYDYLNQRIAHWSSSPFVERMSAGTSTSGYDMPLLKITDGNVPDSEKKVVYIHARTHTSEAPCSWHLDAMLERLSDAEDGYAAELRKNIVFYVVPFANPDGVIFGLSRSNVTGVNQEINWDRPDSLTVKEVRNLKSVIVDILERHGRIDMFLNMHSQIDDFATYWIHTAESTSDRFFADLMRFARLTVDGNPYMKFGDLQYSDLAPRYAEGWIWKLCGEEALAVTFETPYTYYSENPYGEWVTLDNLASFADHTLKAVGDYFNVSSSEGMIFSLPEKRRARITFDVEPGEYEVYGLYRSGENGWEKIYVIGIGKKARKTLVFNGKEFHSVKIVRSCLEKDE